MNYLNHFGYIKQSRNIFRSLGLQSWYDSNKNEAFWDRIPFLLVILTDSGSNTNAFLPAEFHHVIIEILSKVSENVPCYSQISKCFNASLKTSKTESQV